LESFNFNGAFRSTDAFQIDITALGRKREVNDVGLLTLKRAIIDHHAHALFFLEKR
jgi:hypothetical protein